MARKSAEKTAGTGTKRGRGGKVEKLRPEPSRGEAVVGERPEKTPSVSESGLTLAHDQIANRARAIWERRGCPEGEDEQIWLEAESELKRETGRG
jgi:hypothetical protein